MSYIKFEELKSRTLSEQVEYLEEKIQDVRDRKAVNTTRIRQLEENNENLNSQIETLLEMKWSCKTEERINEAMDRAEEILNGELSENEIKMMSGGNPDNKINKMNITMEQYHNYLSLYDYLGKAAGQQLGEEVNTAAKKQGVDMVTKDISNYVYTGKVHMYPVEFLDEYFKG